MRCPGGYAIKSLQVAQGPQSETCAETGQCGISPPAFKNETLICESTTLMSRINLFVTCEPAWKCFYGCEVRFNESSRAASRGSIRLLASFLPVHLS